MEEGAHDPRKAPAGMLRKRIQQKKDEEKKSDYSNTTPTDEQPGCSCGDESCEICLVGCGTVLSYCFWGYLAWLHNACDKVE